ncbi:hypothetical protein [Bdellovibrio sp. HCB337]|uniref:hypothetical protein n=1 Tax=Bdellovibrio sp. HCB337 TaxID=3394358 RepID=UPI0039A6E32B
MKKWILSLAILMTTATSFAALEALDGQETHGGNIVLSEFWNHHNFITSTLAQCPTAQANDLATLWLKNTQKAEVRSAWRVFIGANFDQEVVASNTPKADPPSIFISESLWPKLTEIEKTKIVMHEVLPILGYVDTAYDYSTQLYEVYFKCLVPKATRGSLTTEIFRCNKSAIDSWGASEMAVLGPSGMATAAMQQCLPAILKLQSYGRRLSSCFADYNPYGVTESFFNIAVFAYFPSNERSEVVMDYLLSLKTSDLASECDPKFKKTCYEIQRGIKNPRGTGDTEKLEKLSKKLSCTK